MYAILFPLSKGVRDKIPYKAYDQWPGYLIPTVNKLGIDTAPKP
jgi:hypothetical protein